VYQTATFWAEDAEQFARAAVDRRGQGFCTRYGNPDHAQVAAVPTGSVHDACLLALLCG
jgi:methionine-gamma-lyase